jgi:hypothetical protein
MWPGKRGRGSRGCARASSVHPLELAVCEATRWALEGALGGWEHAEEFYNTLQGSAAQSLIRALPQPPLCASQAPLSSARGRAWQAALPCRSTKLMYTEPLASYAPDCLCRVGRADERQHGGGAGVHCCRQGLQAHPDHARHHEYGAPRAAARIWRRAGADQRQDGACLAGWLARQAGTQRRRARGDAARGSLLRCAGRGGAGFGRPAGALLVPRQMVRA